MPSLSFIGEGQSVQLRDRRRMCGMTGGVTGAIPYQRYMRTELDGSPAYQAQHARKVYDVNHGRPQTRPRTDGVTMQAGMGGVDGESERSILARRAGNAAGAKGPHFRDASSKGEDRAHPPLGASDEDEHQAP